jgi:hypothetical protein
MKLVSYAYASRLVLQILFTCEDNYVYTLNSEQNRKKKLLNFCNFMITKVGAAGNWEIGSFLSLQCLCVLWQCLV